MDRQIVEIQTRWVGMVAAGLATEAEARTKIREETHDRLIEVGATEEAMRWRWKMVAAREAGR